MVREQVVWVKPLICKKALRWQSAKSQQTDLTVRCAEAGVSRKVFFDEQVASCSLLSLRLLAAVRASLFQLMPLVRWTCSGPTIFMQYMQGTVVQSTIC